ncbi:MAG: biopolymer transporter ExbD [Paramuribaculum sp.]|nr:biopolymer transporter ExbD [Paramuribaculum sp.]
MALKRQYDMTSLFSMASMTDVIFLLLIFFMVTSTFVFPTALEVNLPQSSEQTALKPSTRVFVDKNKVIYASFSDDNSEPQPMNLNQLVGFIQTMRAQRQEDFVAIYADEEVPYGTLVEILDIGAKNGLKMVLATKPAPSSAMPQ